MKFILSALAAAHVALADLPIHCTHEQVVGTWEFTMTKTKGGSTKDSCGYSAPDKNEYHFDEKRKYNFVADDSKTFKVHFGAGNTVISADDGSTFLEVFNEEQEGDDLQKIGTYTMVYDEGFEFKTGDKTFFTFFKYKPKDGTSVTSSQIDDYRTDCKATMVGWYNDNIETGCFKAKQVKDRSGRTVKDTTDFLSMSNSKSSLHLHHDSIVSRNPVFLEVEEVDYQPSYSFVEEHNKDTTKSWKAKVHEQFKGASMKHMRALVGQRKWKRTLNEHHNHGKDVNGHLRVSPRSDPHTEDDLAFMNTAEKSWDWRNHNGKNYVTEVSNQGACGSCYAVASAHVLDSRLRIKYDNKFNNTFLSSQAVLSCDTHNQGCEGGYPFLVMKYASEQSIVDETCQPYEGRDSQKCLQGSGALNVNCTSQKAYRAFEYEYVGGYYGACNEARMMKEIKEHGPIVVAFQAPSSLFYYEDGVYSGEAPKKEAQPKEDQVNDWEQTNHAVVAVGWGEDPSAKTEKNPKGKYWIIKNEWGKTWGKDGYFLIARGEDDCGIESMAVTAKIAPCTDGTCN